LKYKLLKIFFLIIFCFQSHYSYSDNLIIQNLKEGKKIIFIRHAIAPGNGDPNNFDINDCKTQRNLNEEGRAQSEKIGEFFKINNIK